MSLLVSVTYWPFRYNQAPNFFSFLSLKEALPLNYSFYFLLIYEDVWKLRLETIPAQSSFISPFIDLYKVSASILCSGLGFPRFGS